MIFKCTKPMLLRAFLTAVPLFALGSVAAPVSAAEPAYPTHAGQSTQSRTSDTPWAATHGNGTVEGTASTTYQGIYKTVRFEGTLTSVAGECHRAQLAHRADLAVDYTNVTDHCGSGATPFTTGGTGMIASACATGDGSPPLPPG